MDVILGPFQLGVRNNNGQLVKITPWAQGHYLTSGNMSEHSATRNKTTKTKVQIFHPLKILYFMKQKLQ